MKSDYEKQGKTTAVVAYITIIGTIIAFFMNSEKQNKFASFHIRQAFGLWAMFYILIALASIFDSVLIHMGFWFFCIILIIYGLIQAAKEKRTAVPIVGSYFQEWFTFIR